VEQYRFHCVVVLFIAAGELVFAVVETTINQIVLFFLVTCCCLGFGLWAVAVAAHLVGGDSSPSAVIKICFGRPPGGEHSDWFVKSVIAGTGLNGEVQAEHKWRVAKKMRYAGFAMYAVPLLLIGDFASALFRVAFVLGSSDMDRAHIAFDLAALFLWSSPYVLFTAPGKPNEVEAVKRYLAEWSSIMLQMFSVFEYGANGWGEAVLGLTIANVTLVVMSLVWLNAASCGDVHVSGAHHRTSWRLRTSVVASCTDAVDFALVLASQEYAGSAVLIVNALLDMCTVLHHVVLVPTQEWYRDQPDNRDAAAPGSQQQAVGFVLGEVEGSAAEKVHEVSSSQIDGLDPAWSFMQLVALQLVPAFMHRRHEKGKGTSPWCEWSQLNASEHPISFCTTIVVVFASAQLLVDMALSVLQPWIIVVTVLELVCATFVLGWAGTSCTVLGADSAYAVVNEKVAFVRGTVLPFQRGCTALVLLLLGQLVVCAFLEFTGSTIGSAAAVPTWAVHFRLWTTLLLLCCANFTLIKTQQASARLDSLLWLTFVLEWTDITFNFIIAIAQSGEAYTFRLWMFVLAIANLFLYIAWLPCLANQGDKRKLQRHVVLHIMVVDVLTDPAGLILIFVFGAFRRSTFVAFVTLLNVMLLLKTILFNWVYYTSQNQAPEHTWEGTLLETAEALGESEEESGEGSMSGAMGKVGEVTELTSSRWGAKKMRLARPNAAMLLFIVPVITMAFTTAQILSSTDVPTKATVSLLGVTYLLAGTGALLFSACWLCAHSRSRESAFPRWFPQSYKAAIFCTSLALIIDILFCILDSTSSASRSISTVLSYRGVLSGIILHAIVFLVAWPFVGPGSTLRHKVRLHSACMVPH
jgi:hypothetical protein